MSIMKVDSIIGRYSYCGNQQTVYQHLESMFQVCPVHQVRTGENSKNVPRKHLPKNEKEKNNGYEIRRVSTYLQSIVALKLKQDFPAVTRNEAFVDFKMSDCGCEYTCLISHDNYAGR